MSEATAGGAPTLSGWTLAYEGFDPEQEPLREALCAVGNGFFASRGAAPESSADGVHYPGTYGAGLYNRLTSEVADRQVEDESIVNLPNWLPLTFRIDGGEWFDLSRVRLADYRQELDLRRAMLTRQIRFQDPEGRETTISQQRFVSMANPNLMALQMTLVPVNWSGRVTFCSALDGRVTNGGVRRYRGLASNHLVPIGAGAVDAETIVLEAATSQSHIRVAEAARTRLLRDGEAIRGGRPGARAGGLDRPRVRRRGRRRRGAGRGEGRRPLLLARARSLRAGARGPQGGGQHGRLRRASRGARAQVGRALGPLLARARGSPGVRSGRAALPHLPPAGQHQRAHRGDRRRGPGSGPRGGGISRPHLLGRAVHLPLLQPAPPEPDPLAAPLPLPAAQLRKAERQRGRDTRGPSTRGRAARTAPS